MMLRNLSVKIFISIDLTQSHIRINAVLSSSIFSPMSDTYIQYACKYAYMYVRICTHMQTYVCAHAHMYVSIYSTQAVVVQTCIHQPLMYKIRVC